MIERNFEFLPTRVAQAVATVIAQVPAVKAKLDAKLGPLDHLTPRYQRIAERTHD